MSYPAPTPPTDEEIAEFAFDIDHYDEATYRAEVAEEIGHHQHWTARDEAEEEAYLPNVDDERDEQDAIDEDRAADICDNLFSTDQV